MELPDRAAVVGSNGHQRQLGAAGVPASSRFMSCSSQTLLPPSVRSAQSGCPNTACRPLASSEGPLWRVLTARSA